MQRLFATFVGGCFASALVAACSLVDLTELSSGAVVENQDAPTTVGDVDVDPEPDAADESDAGDDLDADVDASDGDASSMLDAAHPCDGAEIKDTPFQLPETPFNLADDVKGVAWTIPGENKNFAQILFNLPKTRSDYLGGRHFPVPVPSNAFISGAEIKIERYGGGISLGAGVIKDRAVGLALDNIIGTAPQAKTKEWPILANFSGAEVYGGETEFFGVPLRDPVTGKWLTGADITGSSGGRLAVVVAIDAEYFATSLSAYVKSMQLRIFYCLPDQDGGEPSPR